MIDVGEGFGDFYDWTGGMGGVEKGPIDLQRCEPVSPKRISERSPVILQVGETILLVDELRDFEGLSGNMFGEVFESHGGRG